MSEYSIYLIRKRLSNNRMSEKNQINKIIPVGIFAHLDEKKTNLISSGFFEKDLKITRK